MIDDPRDRPKQQSTRPQQADSSAHEFDFDTHQTADLSRMQSDLGLQRVAAQLANGSQGSRAAAPTAGAAGSDDKTMASAIVTGYRAAQHELDKTGSPDDAYKHLLHVGNVSPEYAGKGDIEQVRAAADSFALALQARSQKSPEKYQKLVELDQQIRTSIGLGAPTKASTNLAGGSDARFAREALGPALDALAIRTRDALKFLEGVESHDQAQRLRTIARIAGDIEFTSEYVLGLLGDIAPEGRRQLASSASDAALAVGKLLRWVRTRPTHEQLEATLLRGVGAFDRALTGMGSEPIANRDEVPLTEGQRHAAELEDAEFDQAYKLVQEAIDALHDGQQSKINLLNRIAVEQDLAKPPAFVPALMKAVLDGALSGIVGQFAKALSSAGTAGKLPRAAEIGGLPVPSGKVGSEDAESILSIGLGSLKTAVAAKLSAPPGGGGIDPTKLALHHFCAALEEAESARKLAYRTKLDELKKRSAVTVAQLRDIHDALTKQKENLAEDYFQQITTAWAQYLAQSRLGTTGRGDDKVSKMDDYFGEERPGGRVLGTSHAGGGGVLSIRLRIERGAAKPTLDPEATQIVGLNSELKKTVLNAADHDLDKVELPKEVHVEAEFARATIALDEKNRVRDVLNWHEVQRYVGGLTAYRFWQLWGKGMKVS